MTNESSAVAALRELVALKELSYRIENWDTDSGKRSAVLKMMDEYARRKPLAWAEAKRVVTALSAAPELPTNDEFESLWETHQGHPADFAADVLERWGGWQPGLLGYGGALSAQGWVMVPVEPTQEMLDALIDSKQKLRYGIANLLVRAEIRTAQNSFAEVYRAMLAAAPAALAVQPQQPTDSLGASPAGTGLCGLRPEPQSVSALRAPIPGAEDGEA